MFETAMFEKLILQAKESKILLNQLEKYPSAEKDEIGNILCRYINDRYMLGRMPSLNEKIYDLADESVGKISKLSEISPSILEADSGCTGAKSAMVKKVLLILSVLRVFDTEVLEESYVSIDTVNDLVETCCYYKRNRM